jgi:hypothetical protein
MGMVAMAAGLRLVPFALAVLLAGCESSIYRTDYLDGGKSVVTDAKQRIVTNNKGNVFWGKNRPRRIVCAESSPDVAESLSRAISASFRGALEGRGTASADVAASMSTAVVQLGERLATVQLLRDGLYRACEAYSNGAISDATYSLIVSRVDQTMVALLTSEMAAGAFGRELASASSSSGALAGDSLSEAERTALNQQKSTLLDQQATADTEVQTKTDEINAALADGSTLPSKISDLKNQRQIAQNKSDKIQSQITSIDFQLLGSSSAGSTSGSVTRAGGGIFVQRSQDNAKYVAQIQETFSDADKVGPLIAACVTSLDSSSLHNGHSSRTEEVVPEIDEKGHVVSSGPRTSPLSDICYKMMKPDGEGRSVLGHLFKMKNLHSERMAMIKSTKEIFDVYLAQCSDAAKAATQTCTSMGKALADAALRKFD